MCGRYSLFAPGGILEALFQIPPLGDLPPRYNIAPGGPVLAVRGSKSGGRFQVQLNCGAVCAMGFSISE